MRLAKRSTSFQRGWELIGGGIGAVPGSGRMIGGAAWVVSVHGGFRSCLPTRLRGRANEGARGASIAPRFWIATTIRVVRSRAAIDGSVHPRPWSPASPRTIPCVPSPPPAITCSAKESPRRTQRNEKSDHEPKNSRSPRIRHGLWPVAARRAGLAAVQIDSQMWRSSFSRQATPVWRSAMMVLH